jgi:HTH-type transcriptional regulator, cell division transcriptional repressor
MDLKPSQSSKELRAKRLKVLRQMLGLTRKDFADQYHIPFSNFQNWEGPRYGGLTEQGAIKILRVCAAEGIETSLAWLMHGVGANPNLTEKFYHRYHHQHINEKLAEPDQDAETAAISQELQLFKQNCNQQTLDLVVTDDGMEPYYRIGEHVAGKSFCDQNVIKAINRDCIIKISSGEILLRHLEAGNNKTRFNLSCINPNTTTSKPIIYDAEVICAAPIIWLRRKMSDEEKK